MSLSLNDSPFDPEQNRWDRYALATAAGGVAIWDWEVEPGAFFVDPQLLTLLGYESTLEVDWFNEWPRFVHPEDQGRLLAASLAYLEGRSPRFEIEHRLMHQSGGYRWFVTRGMAVRDAEGKVARVLGASTDVTERKQALLALVESEERFRQLAENIPQIFWLMDYDLRRVLYISPAYEEITGFPCAELYRDARAWQNPVHPDDREFVGRAVQERRDGVRTGRTRIEYRYLRPDGSIRWMSSLILPVHNAEGVPYRIAGIAEDVTDRKIQEDLLHRAQHDLAAQVELRTIELTNTVRRLEREVSDRLRAENALRASESRFRRLFESNIIGAMIAELDGRITHANDAFLELTGYSQKDLPLRWDKMTPSEFRGHDERKLVQLRTEGIATPWEKEYYHKSGRRIPIFIGAAQLDDQAETCIAFVIDLTDRKATEEEISRLNGRLDQASRLSVMGEMVAGLAHELHQPLAVIANYANGARRRLKQKKATIKELDQHLRDIAAESMRAAEVLRRIRHFLLRRATERENVSINAVIQDALKLGQFDPAEHRTEVVTELAEGLPLVFADPIQITQVILNLLLNGLQAMATVKDRPRRITIQSMGLDDGLVQVSISDTGEGMEEEDLSRVFEQFFTTKQQGLGMGLSISRSIVEAHGGRLQCESVKGVGSVFRFTLNPQHQALDTDEGSSSVITASLMAPKVERPSQAPE